MSAATDWANKRKAQMARAEQLRAQRKAGISGIDDGSSHTFKPTLQARPKYLDEQHSFAPQVTKKAGYGNDNRANGDSLDNLADNIFEQPLPGNRGANQTKQQYAGAIPSGGGHGAQSKKQLSPGSDALGAEMRLYGGDEGYQGRGSNSSAGYQRQAHHGAPTGDRRYDEGDYVEEQTAPRSLHVNAIVGDGGYKSKFMQQYESPAPQRESQFFQEEGNDRQQGHQLRQQQSQYRDRDYDDYDEPPQQRQPQRQQSSREQVQSNRNAHTPIDTEGSKRQPRERSDAGGSSKQQQPHHERTDADLKAEDEFLRSLRSEDAPSSRRNQKGVSGSKKQSTSSQNKPGWNEDFVAASGSGTIFGAPPPLRGGKKQNLNVSSKVSTRREANGSTTSGRTSNTRINTNVGDDMPLPTQVNKSSNRGFGSEYPDEYPPAEKPQSNRRQPRQEWDDDAPSEQSQPRRTSKPSRQTQQQQQYSDPNGDYEPYNTNSNTYGRNTGDDRDYDEQPSYSRNSHGQSGSSSLSERARKERERESASTTDRDLQVPQYAASSPRGNSDQGNGQPVQAARSRLSLLKHKIRLSESSTGSRQQRGLERSNSAEFDNLDVEGYGRGDYMISPRQGSSQQQPKTAPAQRQRPARQQAPKAEWDSGGYDEPPAQEYVSPRGGQHHQSNSRKPMASTGRNEKPKFKAEPHGYDNAYNIDHDSYEPYKDQQQAAPQRARDGGAAASKPSHTSGGSMGMNTGAGVFNADIYSAAANMPGAYPDGEGAPTGNDDYDPPVRSSARNQASSRFDDDDDDGVYNTTPSRNTSKQSNSSYGRSNGQTKSRTQSSAPPRNGSRQQQHRSTQEYDDGQYDSTYDSSQYEKEPKQSSYGGYENAYGDDAYGNNDPNQPQPNEPLMECRECGRKMRQAALQKHSKICAKVFQQKRKAFDSKKMRIEAIAADAPEVIKLAKEAARNEKRSGAAAARGAPKAPRGGNDTGKGKWAEQSRQFREAMRASRQVSKSIASGGPLPEYKPAAVDPSFVQCPHCSRNFNEKAADRHIPLCNNIKAKPSVLKAGSGRAAVSAAGSNKTRKRGVQF